jgi:outer membrane receptor for Fe3+-dicitrate
MVGLRLVTLLPADDGQSWHHSPATPPDHARISGDFLYGSGLRRTPDGGAPNSAALPSYFVVNSAVTHLLRVSARSSVEARLAVLNLFDKTCLLRDGTGVGVGAPQYGLRRSLYAGLTATF